MKFKSGGRPKTFFGNIAITRPRIDEFSPNLVCMRGMGFRTMRNGQQIPDPRSNFAWGHPKPFGVIRGNWAADERIFTKFK